MACTCKNYQEFRANAYLDQSVTIAETCRECEPETYQELLVRRKQQELDILYPTNEMLDAKWAAE